MNLHAVRDLESARSMFELSRYGDLMESQSNIILTQIVMMVSSLLSQLEE